MPASNIDRWRETLDELFMLDRADLDFGLYRIMNVRRDEVRRFLDHDLLPKVRAALGQMQAGERAATEAEIRALEKTLRDADVDPATSPKFRELEAKYHAGGDTEADEAEVYGHLVSFFRRYYKEGDFISLRRYKEGVYAIPYEGEEVKLHWANADQYYIKSTEQFRDYTFLVSHEDEPERRVHFKLVEADTERNNNRAQAGQDRRFVLIDGDSVAEVEGDLVVRFEYRPANGAKQDALNTEAEAIVLDHPAAKAWRSVLARDVRRESAKDALSLLRKHLNTYTAKNTFDYFIHKDLGGFLRRELDFYLKNEVLRLDDIDTDGATSATLDAALRKVRALRAVGLPIIEFLASMEEFQKRLWLKKKFVVETHWCVTLDRVPGELYAEVAANDRQREEWVRLFAIDEIKGDMVTPAYSVPLSEAFLEANQHLVIDTSLFDRGFTERLLTGIDAPDGLDAQIDGLLVHSDNFQALNLLQSRFRDQVQCVYIDPPYNTGSSSIPYRNDYRHSSWVTLMFDRLLGLRPLMRPEGGIFVSIDKTERTVLEHAMDLVFGQANRVQELIWSMNTNNSQSPNYSTNHEYVLAYAKDRPRAEAYPGMFREPKPGFLEVMDLVATLNPDYPPVSEIEQAIKDLYAEHRAVYREEVEAAKLAGVDVPDDEWRGLYNYNRAEYRDEGGCYVPEDAAGARQARIWVWREADSSMPATKQSETTAQSDHPNYRFYRPPHPMTGAPAPHPKSGWKFAYANDEESPDRRSFVSLDQDHRIAWGSDEKKIPQLKRMLHEVETNVAKSVFQDYSDGEKQTSAMFGRSGVFLAPKHANFVSRFIAHTADPAGITLDCFGGSGSTAHAVLTLNRADGGQRKYILVEMGEYFDTVLKPRVLKAVYSKDWKDGKAVGREGVSQLIKVIRLESYEDTLTNLRNPNPSDQQASMLAKAGDDLRRQYALRYWLTEETRGSASLLDLERFEDPWSYTLEVGQGSAAETKPTTVDLVETFNYLLGLRVRHVVATRDKGPCVSKGCRRLHRRSLRGNECS